MKRVTIEVEDNDLGAILKAAAEANVSAMHITNIVKRVRLPKTAAAGAGSGGTTSTSSGASAGPSGAPAKGPPMGGAA